VNERKDECELIIMTQAWDKEKRKKEKFTVPDRNQTHDLLSTGQEL